MAITNFYEQVIELLKAILAALGGGGGGDPGGGSGSTLPPTPASGFLDVGSGGQDLPDVPLNRGIHIKLDVNATDPVFVGVSGNTSVNQDYQLSPGNSVYLEVSNANQLAVVSSIATYGTVRVYYLGS